MLRVLIVMLVVGVSPAARGDEPTKPRPAPRILSSENGRYVFGQVSEYRRDQYMLDTKTGRLWVMVLSKTDAAGESIQVLQPVLYQGIDGSSTLEPK
jgi:hypothetical protein